MVLTRHEASSTIQEHMKIWESEERERHEEAERVQQRLRKRRYWDITRKALLFIHAIITPSFMPWRFFMMTLPPWLLNIARHRCHATPCWLCHDDRLSSPVIYPRFFAGLFITRHTAVISPIISLSSSSSRHAPRHHQPLLPPYFRQPLLSIVIQTPCWARRGEDSQMRQAAATRGARRCLLICRHYARRWCWHSADCHAKRYARYSAMMPAMLMPRWYYRPAAATIIRYHATTIPFDIPYHIDHLLFMMLRLPPDAAFSPPHYAATYYRLFFQRLSLILMPAASMPTPLLHWCCRVICPIFLYFAMILFRRFSSFAIRLPPCCRLIFHSSARRRPPLLPH